MSENREADVERRRRKAAGGGDRAQTSGPPAEPVPQPEELDAEQRADVVEAAERQDPTAETGQAG
jgi:hypothetical protein